MTKLLIYSHAFAPKIGGVETLVMSLAKGLSGRQSGETSPNPQVTVVTRTPRGAFDDNSLTFRIVRRPSLAQLLYLLGAADVVHLGGPAFLPLLLGRLLGKPVVVEHSGYQAICPNGLLLDERSKTACPGHFMCGRYGECVRCNAANGAWGRSLAMLLLAFPRHWMCEKVARNVVPSAHVGDRLALPGTMTIYHGVPKARSFPLPVRPRFASPVSFAYVGRLVSEKGLNLLLASARRLYGTGCSFRLKFIGDGPERSRLEAAVDASGLRSRVDFTGYLQGEDLEKELKDVTAVVMPSIWEETAGLAALEHMMRGRMVIAADIGGLKELVDGTGLKFRPGDIDGLTRCMKRVLDEPAHARALGENAKKRAEEAFPEERMLAEHLTLYNQLVKPTAAPPRLPV
jgi:glycosyltransferase involved in cell wall biosynthesis